MENSTMKNKIFQIVGVVFIAAFCAEYRKRDFCKTGSCNGWSYQKTFVKFGGKVAENARGE